MEKEYLAKFRCFVDDIDETNDEAYVTIRGSDIGEIYDAILELKILKENDINVNEAFWWFMYDEDGHIGSEFVKIPNKPMSDEQWEHIKNLTDKALGKDC